MNEQYVTISVERLRELEMLEAAQWQIEEDGAYVDAKIRKEFDALKIEKGHNWISFKGDLGVPCKITVEWHKLKFAVYSNRQMPDYVNFTQEQVKELLPYLQNFAETGSLTR